MDEIQQIQQLEQNLQSLLMQKQQLQQQLFEAESALKELDSSKKCYRIVGNIMIESKSEDLKKDLTEKQEQFSTRLQLHEKREEELRSKVKELQEKAVEQMKNGNQ